MANREIINKGLEELMKMRVADMEEALGRENPSEFLIVKEKYIEAKVVAERFIDVSGYDGQFARLCEEYSQKNNGVMLR